MNPIPKRLRETLSKDPFMQQCCLCKEPGEFPGRIEWHHAIEYRGRQLNERWAIVPTCGHHHKNDLRKLRLVALNRATDQELIRISKSIDFIKYREFLRDKFKECYRINRR